MSKINEITTTSSIGGTNIGTLGKSKQQTFVDLMIALKRYSKDAYDFIITNNEDWSISKQQYKIVFEKLFKTDFKDFESLKGIVRYEKGEKKN